MANTVSALKRVRITERRTRSIGPVRPACATSPQDAPSAGSQRRQAPPAVPQTFSLIDRAAKWGIIKKNTAARYKSRLTLPH